MLEQTMKTTILLLSLLLTLYIGPLRAQSDEDINEPRIHVIISDEIQAIMQELNALVNARGMTGLERMEQRVNYLNALVETIDDLAGAAKELNEAIPGIALTPENKITFEALATRLQEEAVSLRREAEDANFGGVEPAYQRLQSTCDACHQLFRF